MTYEPVNVTYNNNFGGAGVSAVLYTVPTGRKAKITFIALVGGSGFYLKVNSTSSDTLGYLFTSTSTFGNSSGAQGIWNAVDWGIYLNEGDTLAVYASGAGTASLFVSLIEEY